MDQTPKTWAVLVARWWNGTPFVGYKAGSRDATVDELRLVAIAMPQSAKLPRDEEFEVRVRGTKIEVERRKMAS